MNRRRIAALAAFGLVGVGVVVLIASDRDDEPASVAAPAPDTAGGEPADDVDAPRAGQADAESDPSETDGAAEAPAEAVALRYDPELVPELPDRGPHPPLIGLDGWQQSDIAALDELRGTVVAVQFWTFGCHNCTATTPHLAALYEKYGGEDFEIVGVHSPEFDYEKDPDRIAEAAIDLNVTWPIALDTEKRSFRSWQEGRRFWPRIYLIDRDGNIRYDKIGEGRYDEIDAAVGALIDEPWDGELAAELDEWVERDVDDLSHPM